MKDEGLSNCLLFVLKKEKECGGYIARRKTRHNHAWPLFRYHYLWLPEICPDHGTPCPYFESAVPIDKLHDKFPLPLFKFKIVKGDLKE
jgi:hypothetical protein